MATSEPEALANLSACCGSGSGDCVFARALLLRAASCELAQRRAVGERDVVACGSPVARTNCQTLAALLHERARFALRLPRPGTALMHAQALRLQCGGLAGLQQALGGSDNDVHRMVGLAHERLGSLTELPWPDIVATIVEWRARPRRAPQR